MMWLVSNFYFFWRRRRRKESTDSSLQKNNPPKKTRLKFHLKRTNVQPRTVWAAIDFILTCKIWATSLTFSFLFFFHSSAPPHPPPLNHPPPPSLFSPSYLFSRAHRQAGQRSRCSWRSAPAKHSSVVTLLGMKQNASARKRTGLSRAESFEEQRGHPPSSWLDISLSRLLFFFFLLLLLRP